MSAEKIMKVREVLAKRYPDPKTTLQYNNVFELLIATILSAQTTDKQVNKVTTKLFNKYKKPQDYAILGYKDLEKEIKSLGLSKNKSRYIIETSKTLFMKFAGVVPDNRKELMTLPGVGRKTANVILACGFLKNTFPVDTHVFRVTNRLGLVDTNKYIEVEKKIMKLFPENEWIDLHHRFIYFGREVCKAANPNCTNCELKFYCNFYLEGVVKDEISADS